MDDLMEHPIAIPFFKTPEEGPLFPARYFQIVKRPIDLTVVRNRLDAGRYKSVDQWQIDVNRVFSNWKAVWTEGHEYEVADEVEAMFENYCSKFDLLKVVGWTEEVMRLRDRIGKLNFSPPTTGAFDLGGIFTKEPVSSNLPTEKDWKSLISTMKDISTDEDAQIAIIEILRKEEPQIPLRSLGDNRIDLLELKPTTFHMINDFVKSRVNGASED